MKSFWGGENRYLRIRHTGIDISGKMAKLFLGGFSIIILIIFTVSDVGFINLWKAQKKLERVKSEIRELEMENLMLEEKIFQIQNSTFALEKVAREKYGYIKPGDRVLRINVVPDKKREPNISSFLDIDEGKD
jgi:cell division protein FtsB